MTYRAIIIKNDQGEICQANIARTNLGYPDADFCCQDMKDAWGESFIGFGDYEPWGNRITSLCIYSCSPYPEGACWEHMQIRFCPFCGAKIVGELQEVRRGDST